MPKTRSKTGNAEGNIHVAVFVKPGAAAGGVLECTAADKPMGISFKDTRRSDYVDTSGYAAESGEPVSYYTQAAECWLQLVGTVAVGDLLSPSTNGAGIVCGHDTISYGARALEAGVSGDFIKVEIVERFYMA